MEFTSVQVFTTVSDSGSAEKCVTDVYFIQQDIQDILQYFPDFGKILPKITDAVTRAEEAYDVCQSATPQELLTALENHANKEGVSCLQDTLKYSNEIQDILKDISEGTFDFSKFLDELKDFYDNLPAYIDNCSKMEFHF